MLFISLTACQQTRDKNIISAEGIPNTDLLRIAKSDIDEVIDGIGDAVVVLTNLAELQGVSIEKCINVAYNTISQRSGKMVNGTFKKD